MQQRLRRYQRRGGTRKAAVNVSFPLYLRDLLDQLAERHDSTFSAEVVKAVKKGLRIKDDDDEEAAK